MIEVLDKTKAFLVANLQAEATTIAGAQSPVRVIDTIPVGAFFTAWKRPTQFPSIFIAPTNTVRVVTLDEPNYVYAKSQNIIVTVVYRNADVQMLQDTILIYCKAIEKLIVKNPQFEDPTPVFNRVEWTGIDYSDLVSGLQDKVSMQMGLVSISITPEHDADELGISNG